MSPTRTSFHVDTENNRIVIRVTGDMDNRVTFSTITEAFKSVATPWIYDILMDLRRYEAFVRIEELDGLAQYWKSFMNDRDKGRAVVLVTTNPVVMMRKVGYELAFPNRLFKIFETLDEGLDWLNTTRTA